MSTAFTLFGCSVDGATNKGFHEGFDGYGGEAPDMSLPTDSVEYLTQFEKLTDVQQEFEYCYSTINNNYLFAHSDSLKPKGTAWYKHLGKRSDYFGKGYDYYTTDEKDSAVLDIYYMFSTLADSYTYYIDPDEISFDQFIYEFDYLPPKYDIGVNAYPIISENDTSIVIMQLYMQSGAAYSDLSVGDTVLEVSGIRINSLKIFEKLVSGDHGEIIPMKIARNEKGERVELDISVKITPYKDPTVTYITLDSIPIITISQFADPDDEDSIGTYMELVNALKQTEGAKSTIIDLRGNPGGSTPECLASSAEFLSKNDTMFYQYEYYGEWYKPNSGKLERYPLVVTEDGMAKDRYVVLLANSMSGSCSEVMLEALTSQKKSPIVGETSYGKGIGYILTPSLYGGVIAYTATIIENKDGETFHMRGIAPDVEQEYDSKILDTALVIAKEAKLERTAGYAKEIQKRFTTLPKKGTGKKAVPAAADLGMYTVKKSGESPRKFTTQD